MNPSETNESQFGSQIKKVLDGGLELDAGVRARLSAARERAVAAARPERLAQAGTASQPLSHPVAAGELAGAGMGGGTGGGMDGRSGPFGTGRRVLRVALPAAILVAAVIGWQHWQQSSGAAQDTPEDQLGQLDAEVLKSDIPIDALLDRDFHAYIKRASERE